MTIFSRRRHTSPHPEPQQNLGKTLDEDCEPPHEQNDDAQQPDTRMNK